MDRHTRRLAAGEELRRHRGARGLSQKALAGLADVSMRTVRRVEAGEPASDSVMEKIAVALSLPLDWHVRPSVGPHGDGGAVEAVLDALRAWDVALARDEAAFLAEFIESIAAGGSDLGVREARARSFLAQLRVAGARRRAP